MEPINLLLGRPAPSLDSLLSRTRLASGQDLSYYSTVPILVQLVLVLAGGTWGLVTSRYPVDLNMSASAACPTLSEHVCPS